MARDWPVLEGALATARWPDELEKPDPGFPPSWAGWSCKVSCCWGGPGFACFKVSLLLAWAGFRVGQFVAGLPPLLLFFFAAVGWAGWSFVHRPFPPLDEHPILVLVEYHTPNFFDALVVWYYVTPFAVVMLTGFISVTILEGLAGRAAERFRILLQAPAVAA